MILEQAGSYIVRGVTPMGESYHHVELPSGYDTSSHTWIGEIMTGPHPDAETAWNAFKFVKNENRV